MELGLQFEDILCYEATAAISSAHEESLETAIPEYCPDIARIVEATGRLTIREKQLNEERCTISGSVKVTVLYTSEEATGLRSLTMSVPFSCVMDDRTLTRCGTVCAEGRVLLTEARAVTGSRLPCGQAPPLYRHAGGVDDPDAVPQCRAKSFDSNI